MENWQPPFTDLCGPLQGSVRTWQLLTCRRVCTLEDTTAGVGIGCFEAPVRRQGFCRCSVFVFRALLQGRGGAGWLAALLVDCRAIQCLLFDKLGSHSHPAEEPQVWEHIWSSFPVPWRSLLRMTLSRAAENPWQADAARADARAARCTAQEGDVDEDEFMCGVFGKLLNSPAAVTLHGFRVHGLQGDAARARGTVVGSWSQGLVSFDSAEALDSRCQSLR